MVRLNGIVLKHLVDVGVPHQPRWVGATVTGEDVYIQYDNGTLMIKFSGQTEGYLEEVSAPADVRLTTEVMLLLTGLRVF